MASNRDYKDLLKCFDDENVEYLVVGAYAVTYYAEPRFTKDLDLWVRPSKENADRVWSALKKFGAPLTGIRLEDFTDPEMVYQMGVAPNRIDIVMGIDGVDFDEAWKNRTESTYDNVPTQFIGKDDLIKNKKAMNRPQDLLDLDGLT